MINYSLDKLKRLTGLLLLLPSIMLIVYSVGGRALVTLIPGNQSFILHQIAQAVGNEVRASAIESGWNGLAPWLRIRDFEIVTASGLAAIDIDLIEFNVHPGYSLMAASPAAEILRVTGADLQLVQHQHGGLGLKGGQSNIAIDLKPLLDFVLDSGSLSISDTRIRLASKLPQLNDRLFDLMVGVQATTTGTWKNLRVRVTDLNRDLSNPEPTQLIIAGAFQGDLGDLESVTADIHLRANTLNSEHWFNSLQIASSQVVFAADDLAATLHVQPDHRMNARFNFENLHGRITSASEKIMPLAIATGSASLQRESTDTWGIQIATEHGKVGKNPLKPIIFKAAFTKQDGANQYWLTSSELNFKPIKDILLFEEKLPAGVRRWLTKIRPEALLKNVYSQIKHIPGEPLQLAVAMDLEAVQTQAFNAIPFLDGLQGKLLVFESGGLLKVDAESFRVAFPSLVDPVLPVDKARFDLLFAFEPDAFFIRTDNINVASPYGSLSGGFVVHNPQSVHLRTLSMQLAFGNTNLDTFLKLLPKQLPADFKDWLRDAVLDGQLMRGGAIYHSHLLPYEPFDLSSLGLILDVQSVGFDYDPAWPQINQSQGRVYVTETDTQIFLAAAQMFGLKLNNIDVFVPVTSGAAQPIRIFGRTAGQLSQMVDFIRRTPARDFVDPNVLAWRITGEGEFDIDLDLVVNISAESSSSADSADKVVVILDGNITQARLDIKELDLTFANSQGHLKIDSENGVFSEGIDFDVFDGRAHARMWSDWNERDNEKLYMELNGTADIRTLATWLDFPGLRLLTGQFQYSGDAAIVMTPETPVEMWLSSDLVGLDIPLPMPFTKTLTESRPAVLNFAIDEQGVTEVKVGIESSIRALLELVGGEMTRGTLQLNNEVPLVLPPTPVGLEVYGHIDGTDFGHWLDYIDAIDAIYAQHSGYAVSGAPEVLNSIAVDGESMTVGDFEITDFELQMNRDKPKQLWLAKIASIEATGDFKIYDDDTKPVLAHLQQISVIYEDETEVSQQAESSVNSVGAVSSDPLAGVDFEDLVAMKVQIDQLQIDKEDYGSWAFNMKPMAGSVEFSNLSASIRGLLLGKTASLSTQTSPRKSANNSMTENTPARLIWSRTVSGDVSRYVGHASAGNLGEIMASWAYPSTLVTETAYMDIDVKWPGSPAMFDWLTVRGQTELDFHRGGVTGVNKDVSTITRAISLLDASFWIRRLYLDFADLQSEGVVFDRLHGTIFFEAGVVRVDEPVRLIGPGADLAFAGSVNMINEELDGELVATLPLSKNLPWLAAYLALSSNPITGAITFLAERIFRKRIERLSSARYVVKGTIEDPEIVLAKVFNTNLTKEGSDSSKQAPANPSLIEVVSPVPQVFE